MDLSINFECPECRTIHSRNVTEIALGKRQDCLSCGSPTELTEHGLEEFRRRLCDIYGV